MSDLPSPIRVSYEHTAEWLRARRQEAWDDTCPARFVDATLASLTTEQRSTLTVWADGGPTGNLILRGPVGTGKTHAAFAVLRSLYVERAVGVAWYSLTRMLRKLKPDGGLSVEELIVPEVLLVDDIGTEKQSEWTAEVLDAVFDERYAERRATIVTTNLGKGALRAALGDRAYSRLAEGEALGLSLDGPDRRRPDATLEP